MTSTHGRAMNDLPKSHLCSTMVPHMRMGTCISDTVGAVELRHQLDPCFEAGICHRLLHNFPGLMRPDRCQHPDQDPEQADAGR